ncbi:MAG: tRNA pseudouridine(55) synthase TruB [Clostridia bacterium]|nr:tRNA pseudouridine(55) synthase TruB [Clostridia bacterium]
MNGVLFVDKPGGMTSHDVVSKIRKLSGTRQVGHTGTLDPMATGLLVVLVGRAVKASEYLLSGDKEYEAVMRLGVETDTGDLTGRVISESGKTPSFGEVLAVLGSFTGEQYQVPPMYSALKVGGVKLCDAARRGVEIPREPRKITVYSLSASETGDPRDVRLLVSCSAGTYIRTLCEDIGKALGCGAAMAALRRTRACGFHVSGAKTLGELSAMSHGELCDTLIPVERLFSGLPALRLPEFYEKLCKNGCSIYLKKLSSAPSLSEGERVRLLDPSGAFFALGQTVSTPEGPAVRAIKRFDIEKQ